MKIFNRITVMKVNGTIAKGIIAITCFTRNHLFFIIHFCFCTVANFRNLYHSTTTPFTDYLCNKKNIMVIFLSKRLQSYLQGISLQSEQSNSALVRRQILIFANILDPNEIGPFMPQSSVFIEMMFWAIYGQKCKYPKKN